MMLTPRPAGPFVHNPVSNSTEIIQQFAQAAIQHAHTELQRQEPDAVSLFSVAGITVALSETEPLAVDWLSGQFDEPAREAAFHVYCDYSNWQARHGPSHQILAELSTLDVDRILNGVGLRGNFYAPLNHWDLFDPETGTGVRLQTEAEAHPVWEPTAPLAQFLSWVMRVEGKTVLHAATLGVEGAGILLAGSGGSGKSGTTLAGVLNGLSSVGDDYCVMDLAGDSVRAHPFFRKMKQDRAGLKRVNLTLDSASVDGPNWQGKFVFDLRTVARESAVNSLEIQAVLLPKINHAENTEYRPARSLEVFRALCPSTMKQLSGDRTAVFAACAEITRRVRGFHLLLGTDPEEISATVSKFIQKECV